jgi:hypothetical protein
MPEDYYKHKIRLNVGSDTIADSLIAGGTASACHDLQCSYEYSVKTDDIKHNLCSTSNVQICENNITFNNSGKIGGKVVVNANIECSQNGTSHNSEKPQDKSPDKSSDEPPGTTKSNQFAKVAAIVVSAGILIAIIMYILRTLRLAKTVAAVV